MTLLLAVLLLSPVIAAAQEQQRTESGIERALGERMDDSSCDRCDSSDNRKIVWGRNIRFGYSRESGPSAATRLRLSYGDGSVWLGLGGSVRGWYKVSVGGENMFNTSRATFAYEATTEQSPVFFYGVGHYAPRINARTRYCKHISEMTLAYMRCVAADMWIGGGLNYSLVKARRVPDVAWKYLQASGDAVRQVRSAAVAGVVRYDSRREEDKVERGISLSLMLALHPDFLNDCNHALWHTSLRVSTYCPLWRGATWVMDILGEFWSYHAPWLLWPSVGIDKRFRIYAFGRYVDRNMMAMHASLRQYIYGPFGAEMWGGAASMFDDKVRWSQMLPTFGVGARINIRQGLVIGVGYGWGKRADGFVVYVNDRF